MNCVLFTKMDQVISLKKKPKKLKTSKKLLENGKIL